MFIVHSTQERLMHLKFCTGNYCKDFCDFVSHFRPSVKMNMPQIYLLYYHETQKLHSIVKSKCFVSNGNWTIYITIHEC